MKAILPGPLSWPASEILIKKTHKEGENEFSKHINITKEAREELSQYRSCRNKQPQINAIKLRSKS